MTAVHPDAPVVVVAHPHWLWDCPWCHTVHGLTHDPDGHQVMCPCGATVHLQGES